MFFFFIFVTLKGLFLIWFWFVKIWNYIWIRITNFGEGVCFIKFFDLRPPYIFIFDFFGTLGGVFKFDFWFLKILKLYLNQNYHFWGGLFHKTFWFEASLYMLLIFGTLGGLFLVWFLVFENFKIIFWIRIPTFGGSVLWNFLIWGFLDDFIHSSGIIFFIWDILMYVFFGV